MEDASCRTGRYHKLLINHRCIPVTGCAVKRGTHARAQRMQKASSYGRIAVSGRPRRSYRLRESRAPTLMHSHVGWKCVYTLRFICTSYPFNPLKSHFPFNRDNVITRTNLGGSFELERGNRSVILEVIRIGVCLYFIK